MRWYYLVMFAAAISLGLAGCRRSEPPKNPEDEGDAKKGNVAKKANATIDASPNPVPAGSEKFGTTTITWDTGDGSLGEVYVSINGGEEKRFSGARAKGSQEAAWIGKAEHEFRLYAGKEHTTLLAKVRVTRAQ